VPRVKSHKIKPYLVELKKARDVAVKDADPTKPVTKFTAFKKEVAKQAQKAVEELETIEKM
jgi:hypothetical protein